MKTHKETFFRNEYGYIKDDWEIVLAGTLLILAIIFMLLLFIVPTVLHEIAKCNQLADFNPQLEFVWTRLNGCMVRTSEGGVMMPVSKLFELVSK